MNELSKLFKKIEDGAQVRLERKVYEVRQDDSYYLTGYYCSNTTSMEENPLGERFVAIFLKDKKNIVIDGNGATLLIHGKMTPFLFDGCENITLKNIAIDYARPTMSEFTVVSVSGSDAIIKINDEYLYEIEDGVLYWLGEKDLKGEYYWRHPYRGKNIFAMQQSLENNHNHYCPNDSENVFPSVPKYKSVEVLDKNTLKLTYENACPLEVNATYQTRCVVRDQIGGFSTDCKDLYFENLTIYAMHGFGILSQFCENVTVKNVIAVPKAGRTITSNADFFQFSACKGEILLEDCVMSAGQDDFINLHGTYLLVTKVNEQEKSVEVEYRQEQTWGFTPFKVGDIVDVVEGDTLLSRSKKEVTKVETFTPYAYKVYFKQAVEEIKVGDALENITWTPSLTVRNCRFYTSMAHGILCTTRGQVRVEGCSFENLGCEAIAIAGCLHFWYESGPISEFVVKNCTFKELGYGPGVKIFPYVWVKPSTKRYKDNEYYHGKLILEENEFINEENKTHLSFRNISQVILKGNVFTKEPKIECEHVGELKIR